MFNYFLLFKITDQDLTKAEKVYSRIGTSCQHLTDNNHNPTSNKVTNTSHKVQQHFLDVLKMFNKARERHQANESFQHSFTKLEEDFENWLTETEVKMIALQPYTSDDEDLDDQVKQLKDLNQEIKEREILLIEMLQSRDRLQDDDVMTRRGIADELNERYQKVYFHHIL